MTGDRRLTGEEKAFELTTHRFNALETVKNSGGEPSLFELTIIELSARIDAQNKIIIELGIKIGKLERRVDQIDSR